MEIAIIFALAVSIITASSRIFLKKGLLCSNPLTGMLVSLVICSLVLVILTVIYVPFKDYNLKGILFFAVIGCFAPPLVRYLTYIGVDKVGASISDPIRATTPFFAIILAIIFLKEPFELGIIIGTAFIVCGVLLLAKGKKNKLIKEWKRKDLFFPLAAAFLAGIAANLRKMGFDMLESPVLAATSTALSALIVFGSFTAFSNKKREIILNPQGLKYFILSSLCTAASIILNLFALKHGNVSTVTPIISSSLIFFSKKGRKDFMEYCFRSDYNSSWC